MTNTKKTIAIVCDKNTHTSFGRMTLDLRKALIAEFDVHTIWLTTPKYFPHGNSELPCDCHTIHAPSLELGWALFGRPLRKLLKEIAPDKVLFIRPELGFLVREAQKARPGLWVGVFVHDMFTETLYGRSPKFMLINRFFVNPMRGADGFIYNSVYTRDMAHKVMGLDHGGPVIGCPIDRSVFKPQSEDKSAIREKYGLDRYRGVCMNISLNEPRKNINTFFALAAARPDVAFVRVGPFVPWMAEWIKSRKVGNIIHFSGVTEEQLLELYGCADLFVYPSFLEGFGMPPLEALACGAPVVAASSSALKENLSGVAPLVDPPDRVDGYLEVIDRVLAGQNVINKNATEKLLDRFSIKSFGERARACFRA